MDMWNHWNDEGIDCRERGMSERSALADIWLRDGRYMPPHRKHLYQGYYNRAAHLHRPQAGGY